MTNRQEVLILLNEMLSELNQEKTSEWENATLPRFLEAMHGWLTDASIKDENSVSWDFVKNLLIAGKIYE